MAKYELPELPYGYGDLAPHIGEEQLKLHHSKHHATYVKKANALMDELGSDMGGPKMQALSFNLGGHKLHSLFWENIAPEGEGGGNPGGKMGDLLADSFGDYEGFRNAFTNCAATVQGSGWALLSYCKTHDKPIIFQAEKHNLDIAPGYPILLALDAWEHAYYVDYRNEKKKFFDAFFNVVNWDAVENRLDAVV